MRKLTDSHSQKKKGLFLDKITLFKGSTAQNILYYIISQKIIDMACSLHVPVDCLYECVPEDQFWLETKKKTGSGQQSFIVGRCHWKRNMKQEKFKKMFSKDDGILYYLLMSQCHEALSSSLSGDRQIQIL